VQKSANDRLGIGGSSGSPGDFGLPVEAQQHGAQAMLADTGHSDFDHDDTAFALRPRRGAGTRRRIVEVARRLFSERSYSGVNLEGVAAVSGVTRRTIYNHFIDKSDLYREVHEASLLMLARLTAISIPSDAPVEVALAACVQRAAELLNHPRHAELLCAVIRDGQEQPWLREAYVAQVRRPFVQTIELLLLRASQVGQLQIRDPHTAALRLLSLVEATSSMPLLLSTGVDDRADALQPNTVREIVDVFLHGHRCAPDANLLR
jgi:TetR/AcrR family transcriptional regulator, mexJK operon transcriptional repressor